MLRNACWLAVMMLSVLPSTRGWAAVRDLACDGQMITYTLTEPDTVVLELATAAGDRRVTLFAGVQLEGRYQVRWNGKDTEGQPVAPGNYVLTASVGRVAKKDAQFGRTGMVQFTNPTSLDRDAQGMLYVVDFEKPGNPWGPAGTSRLLKFHPDGTPCPSFPTGPNAAQQTHVLPLPSKATCLRVAGDGSLLCNGGSLLSVLSPAGKVIRTLGGNEQIKDANGTMTPRPGSILMFGGLAVGAEAKVYLRDWIFVYAYDWSKPGFSGYLSTSGRIALSPSPGGCYIGPSVTGRMGRLYTSSQQGLLCLQDANGQIQQESKALVKFRTCLGLAVDSAGMLYVADRGIGGATEWGEKLKPTPQRVYQLWEGGDGLYPVWQFEDQEIQGLRDVAVSPDGKLLYVLEDGDNFAYGYSGKKGWPELDLQGKARLFKYDLSWKQQERKPIKVP